MQVDQEIVKKHGIELYQYRPDQDIALLRLWMRLNETLEINQVFLPSSRRLPEFLARFQSPAVRAFTRNVKGEIDFIVWFTPFNTAVPSTIAGLWSDASIRGSRKLIEVISTIYTAAFTIWTNVFGITRNTLIARHQKMGYNVVGIVPGFFEDEVGVHVHLTKTAFESSLVYRMSQRLKGER